MGYSAKHVHNGLQAGYIDNTGSTEIISYCNVHDILPAPTVAGEKFHCSGWIFSAATSAEIFLICKQSQTSQYCSIKTTEKNHWVYLDTTFTVYSDTRELWMRVDNNGGGKVWFDDLRFYPPDAQMTSYTYAPLIGITSKCDVNNKSTYYVYDALGRLSFIRDDNQNIIKQYCYNYKGQNTNCTLYANNLQVKSFLKNDCSDTSMIGSVEVDSVEANTFYSELSQGDADTMAINYLDSIGQPDANLSGACTVPVTLTLVNYDHINDFTLTLIDSYDSTRSFTIPFPIDSATTTQKIPQGRYNISISKPGNADSHVFTASGPGGSIQVNSVSASWSNVYVNTDVFDKLTIGIHQ